MLQQAVFDVFGEFAVGVCVGFLGGDELTDEGLPVFFLGLGEDALVEVDFPEEGDFVGKAGIDDGLALVAEDGGIVQADDDLFAGVVGEITTVAAAENGAEHVVDVFLVLDEAGLAAGVTGD